MNRSFLDTLVEAGQLRVRFQPIFRVAAGARQLHAFECLTSGPPNTNLESAAVLFDYVRRKGQEAAIDRVCVSNAFRVGAPLQGLGASLSFNAHASTLERDSRFPDFLADLGGSFGVPLTSLIVEIVEHAPSFGGRQFHVALERLRKMGVRIALDDVGIGQSNFQMILECNPDYLKADRYLVQGCGRDQRRRAVLESLVQLSDRLGARLVAEGVEEASDLDAVLGLGIELVQGYLLGRPMPLEELEWLRPAKIPDRSTRSESSPG